MVSASRVSKSFLPVARVEHLKRQEFQRLKWRAIPDSRRCSTGVAKTLHPKIHGGILARRDSPEHMQALQAHAIRAFDMVVVNLYPFEQTVARPDCPFEEAIENIDIGGPSMIRSAAKNHQSVAVRDRSSQYGALLEDRATMAARRSKGRQLALQGISPHRPLRPRDRGLSG